MELASRLLTQVRVGAGKVLIEEGEFGAEFFILGDGQVSVTRHDGDTTKPLAVVGSGDVLGEMSLLHRVPRNATATTLVPTTVYVATRREFFSLLDAVPSVGDRIIGAADLRALANAAA